jgi:acetoacetate decarboxylase
LAIDTGEAMPQSVGDFSFTTPLKSPLYTAPPERGSPYQNWEAVGIFYETDENVFTSLLPEGLQPLHSPPRVALIISDYHVSGIGRYKEAWVSFYVQFQGKNYMYCPYMLYDQAGGTVLAISREMWGFPGKLSVIDLKYEHEQAIGFVERPRGKRLSTLSVLPTESIKPDELEFYDILNLRLIPAVERGRGHDIAQLVSVPLYDLEYKVLMKGTGSLSFDSPSEEDPLYRLRPNRVLLSIYWIVERMSVPQGTVVKDYLRKS